MNDGVEGANRFIRVGYQDHPAYKYDRMVGFWVGGGVEELEGVVAVPYPIDGQYIFVEGQRISCWNAAELKELSFYFEGDKYGG